METLAWGDMPYDSKTPAEVVNDYVLIRGDLSTQHARDQLARWIERYAERPRHAARRPHVNTMIGRLPATDPALVRCTWCRQIAVSCDAARSAGEDCCGRCSHEESA